MIRFFLDAVSTIRTSKLSFLKLLLIHFLSLSLIACATPHYLKKEYVTSKLQEGKRDFNEGYYKRALHQLLPLACDGNPEAQYGVGYMYYYGLGVAQDTDVGYFWIKRSASKGYPPAIRALELIQPE
jgi:TPR repeat protein